MLAPLDTQYTKLRRQFELQSSFTYRFGMLYEVEYRPESYLEKRTARNVTPNCDRRYDPQACAG